MFCVVEGKESEAGGEQDIMQVLGKMVMALLVKYWIYICGGMFFFVSFEGRIVMYKIIYMMMFLSCVALYQVAKLSCASDILLMCQYDFHYSQQNSLHTV